MRKAAGLKLASKKESYGLFDFIVHLNVAETESFDANQGIITTFVDEHPRRFVIQAHPLTKIIFKKIQISHNAVLDFDIGLAPYTYNRPGAGGEFIIKLGRKSIFRHRLDPKNHRKDRGRHDFQVDLSRYGGKATDFTFITQTPDNQFCMAG